MILQEKLNARLAAYTSLMCALFFSYVTLLLHGIMNISFIERLKNRKVGGGLDLFLVANKKEDVNIYFSNRGGFLKVFR